MAATFVNIPAAAVEQAMAKAGFREIYVEGCGERVFTRQHHYHRKVQVRVYSSLTRHGSVRDVGEDRMMVAAFYEGEDRGERSSSRFLFGAKGVNRASSEHSMEAAVKAILDRLLERMREVYAQVNHTEVCPKCREPLRHAETKQGKNKGRWYFACFNKACNHFKWA